MKLLFLSNIPSPYMVNFFNELGQLCDLTVVFEKKASDERDKSWAEFRFNYFEGIILKGLNAGVDSAFCPQIIKYISMEKYDHIIVTNPMTPTGITAIKFMRIKKIPYILESEGGFPKDGEGFKERLKKRIITGASAYFSTTPKADEYFLAYGATKDKIMRYPFTSLYKNELLEQPLCNEEKLVLRAKYRLRGKKIAIAVGRFIPLKNYDVLIRAWREIDNNHSLYIVGGGPEKEKYENIIEQNSIKNVYLLDYMDKQKLFKHYMASDLFIHPTSTDVWGLVINEAMACGLPVITTDMCIAGLELVNDDNGCIVSVDNKEEIVDNVNNILNNEDLLKTMSYNSIRKIKNYTFENMAKVHLETLSIM